MTDPKTIAAWLGLASESVIAGGGVWAAGDYLGIRPALIAELRGVQQTVQSTVETLALFQWMLLDERRKTKWLAVEEQVRYCKLSRDLGLMGEGCA